MKADKIISIAIINGLTLLIFASILAGCQKTSIHQSGLFTKYLNQNNRIIASSNNSGKINISKVDPKQVYIYCQVNDTNSEKCYQKNLNQILSFYEQKNGKLSKDKTNEYLINNSFTIVKEQTENIANELVNKMNIPIGKLVSKRETFCRVNSKYYLKRCLNQYLEKDTMSVLNAYQGHNREMNGHEYLYLKQKIKNKFLISLEDSFKKLKTEEKKS